MENDNWWDKYGLVYHEKTRTYSFPNGFKYKIGDIVVVKANNEYGQPNRMAGITAEIHRLPNSYKMTYSLKVSELNTVWPSFVGMSGMLFNKSEVNLELLKDCTL